MSEFSRSNTSKSVNLKGNEGWVMRFGVFLPETNRGAKGGKGLDMMKRIVISKEARKKILKKTIKFFIFILLFLFFSGRYIGFSGKGWLNSIGPFTWVESFHRIPLYILTSSILSIFLYLMLLGEEQGKIKK